MMALSERLAWLVLGMAVGFILGYIVARLREIMEGVDEIDTNVKSITPRVRNEGGFMRIPVVADVLYILALTIVVWGAFASQKASNEVEATQEKLAATQQRIEKITACTQDNLGQTISALNERTTYTGEQATSNVDLQRAQYAFLAILLEDPPPSDARINASLREYLDALGSFVQVNTKAAVKVKNNPYPTTADYESCLDN